MAQGKPFSLYKRGRFYYAQFKLPNGRWSTAKSTKKSSKGQAERWCIEYLSAGQIITRENVTLEEFSQGFFDWENSWATDKRVRGLRISPRHCRERTNLLNNHLLPKIGKMKLSNIDRAAIKELRNEMFKHGYSGSTINHVLSTLKAILEAAEEQSLIKHIPRIDRAADNPKQKGILTIEEVHRLFSVEWYDFRGYVGNLLAATTGLRMGEIQALTLEDVHLDGRYIHVWRSWDRRLKILNQTTKTGRTRNIFIPGHVQYEVKKLIEINPNPENTKNFLFFSIIVPHRPTNPGVFSKSLYAAMSEIGITEEERRARNITFHSWRHWLNSLLINARIPLQKIQSITGHVTTDMSQHYYHLDDMEDVLELQESIFVGS
jgi:integrase